MNKSKTSIIIINLFIIIIFAGCEKNVLGPNEPEPGRRDYQWSLDTIFNVPYTYFWETYS